MFGVSHKTSLVHTGRLQQQAAIEWFGYHEAADWLLVSGFRMCSVFAVLEFSVPSGQRVPYLLFEGF